MVTRTRTRQLTPAAPAMNERRDLAELAAMRREMVSAITDYIAFNVTHMGKTPEEALAQHRTPLPVDPTEREPEHVGWWELERLLEEAPARGEALWRAIKSAARKEFWTGARMGRAIEPTPLTHSPYNRAQSVVVLEALRKALQPRDGLEETLVQQMVAAYELHLRWTHVAVERAESAVWEGDRDKRRALENMAPRQRERYQETEGWLPPRLSTAEAIDQAVLLADRYQRAFLRLLKAFRDTRRLIGQVIIAGGTLNISEGPQQVNVADQQINVNAGGASDRLAEPVASGE